MDETRRTERNRSYCKESRARKRQAEMLLLEEVEILTLYEMLVEQGPDLFSCHRVGLDAPFSFVSESFYHRLYLTPEDLVQKPLASIVDPRDCEILATALREVLANNEDFEGDDAEPESGTLVNLRVSVRGITYPASMTIGLGKQGLVVVTRLHGDI